MFLPGMRKPALTRRQAIVVLKANPFVLLSFNLELIREHKVAVCDATKDDESEKGDYQKKFSSQPILLWQY